MSTATNTIEALANQEYKYGFVTEIESDVAPRGLNEDIIRLISAKKNEPEWMLEWRLKAYRHWATLEQSEAEPKWANVHYPPIDYQHIIYYAAPRGRALRRDLIEGGHGRGAHRGPAGSRGRHRHYLSRWRREISGRRPLQEKAG
jgi:Fe-S cluster assembly protein SufB